MTTIQMTLEEKLLEEVDEVVRKMNTTRSALIRDSIRQYLKTLSIKQLETKHRSGYMKKPVKPGEFDAWESEQKWGE